MADGGIAGSVKSWNALKGYGFINSESAGIDGDVLFTWRELPEDARDVQGSFLQGRPVMFEAEESADGRVKATSVQLVAVEGQPVAGKIKSYSTKNGYGFVMSSSLEGDARFHRQDIPLAAQGANIAGALVTFVPQALPDGKLRVTQIQFQSRNSSRAMPAFSPQRVALSLPGYGMMPTFAPQPRGMPPRLGGKSMTGKVKSFSEKNGYGFIVSPQQPGTDIKFGTVDLSDGGTVLPGSSVSFTVAVGRDGRAQAKNVTVMPSQGVKREMPGGGGGGRAAAKHQRVEHLGASSRGVVKSYNAAKGFGFIESPGGDIYFMKAQLSDDMQDMELQGQVLDYELASTPDGKLRAASVSLA